MRKTLLLLALAVCPIFAGADDAPIQDNSFLIEEAYNQEAGVVQHIFTFNRAEHGLWASSFTQEWPVASLRHQFSFTIPTLNTGRESGVGDVLLNYRYQLAGDGASRVAFSPRVSIILPTGSERRGLGAGRTGIQGMLPLSIALSPRFVAHANLGATVIPDRDSRQYAGGGSLVWLAQQRINPLVEVLWTRNISANFREDVTLVSPGIRWSYDLSHNLQLVPGVAFPIAIGGHGEKSVFIYFSAEHPFSAN